MASADSITNADSTANMEDLSRKYKRLETNQKDWAAETEKEMKRLQSDISQLQKDNEQMKQQLRQAQLSPFGTSRIVSGQSLLPTGSTGSRIQRVREIETMKDQASTLEDRVASEQRKLDDLSSKIDELKAKIMQGRHGMGGINIGKESNMMVEKQVKILEGRVEKAVIKFNEALHVNKAFREEIDSLRRERGVFDSIYKKLERELQEKKKEMAFIIEVSNIAYEERDNAQNELAQLKVYASKEMHSFDETFKELDDLLEEDRKMKESIKARTQERKSKSDTSRSYPDDETRASSPRLRSPHLPVLKTTGTLSQTQGTTLGPSDLGSQTYEDAINQIKAATNMSDINLLVEKFLNSEDNNFSLFNYVNELNHQIEMLEESRDEVRAELERMRASTGGPQDQQRKQLLKKLEERLETEEVNTKKYASLIDSTTSTMNKVMAAVEKIFGVLECEEQHIVDVQGVPGMSENSLHLFLAAIEGKADEFLLLYRRIHGAAELSPPLIGKSGSIHLDMPTTGDDAHDANSDDDDHVLTRDELLARANQKIAKQQLDNRRGGKRGQKKKALHNASS
eukprot:GGOE01020336.1.p1 GENE.GGOE01020336.1~~GGOE01020336.1.p1  ORF type:complete len:585 (+),score=210.84 GGOE01020336.1:50-1756(+)